MAFFFSVSSSGIYAFLDGSAMMHNFLIFTFVNHFNSMYMFKIHSFNCSFKGLTVLQKIINWTKGRGGNEKIELEGRVHNPGEACGTAFAKKCLKNVCC